VTEGRAHHKADIKVMVVDDTDHVRAMLVDMLQLDGFSVVAEAASGHEAVATVEGLTQLERFINEIYRDLKPSR
jgi:CheY-like chemotaxis protein